MNANVICIDLYYSCDKKINDKQGIYIIQLIEGEEWGVFMKPESTPKSKYEQKGYLKETSLGKAVQYTIF